VAGRAGAQEPDTAGDSRTDTLLAVSYRGLDELVAELPGREVGLGTLVSIADARNLDLLATGALQATAAADLMAARGVFDPRLAFTGLLADEAGGLEDATRYGLSMTQLLPAGTRLEFDVASVRAASPPLGTDDAFYNSSVNLRVRQPLLEGFGQIGLEARLADRSLDAAVGRRERAVREVEARVEVAYWDLAEAEAREAVLLRSFEIADALLFRNRELAERDLVADVDVLTAESGVALRRAALIEGARARADAAEALVFLVHGAAAEEQLARDGALYKTADPPPTIDSPPPLESSIERALERRADLQAARYGAERSEIALSSARNAALPGLYLEGALGSLGRPAPDFGGSFDGLEADPSWSVGLTISQPLGNRGDRGRRVRAEWSHRLDLIQVAVVENRIRREVRSAVRAIASNLERLEAAERAARLAFEQLRAERRRLDLGLGDSFRLLETEENAAQAELALVATRYDLARSWAAYQLAVGGDPGS
jgi:outer membrane protein TolC